MATPTFPKSIFHQWKRVSPIEWGRTWETRVHNNDVTDCTRVVYTENDTERLWSIGLGADYEKNQIGQLHDWSYRYNLCWKQNWGVMTN